MQEFMNTTLSVELLVLVLVCPYPHYCVRYILEKPKENNKGNFIHEIIFTKISHVPNHPCFEVHLSRQHTDNLSRLSPVVDVSTLPF